VTSEVKPLVFGGLSIWPPAMSAPMAGYTGCVYREILREHGCPYCYTEMVSAKGFLLGGDGSEEILRHMPQDRPLAIQLFGHDPEDMAKAALKLQDPSYSFDAIDINMGCPARKVTSQGSGGALLKDLGRAREIALAVKSASRLPVTAKTRLGWDDARHAVEVARVFAQTGLDMLVIHGRTVAEGYSGKADWDAINRAAEEVAIPVVGNGDVSSPEDALARIETGSVAGVMVGRAILGNPVFFEALAAAAMGRDAHPLTPEQKMDLAAAHFQRSVARYGPVKGVLDMRKQLAFYVRRLPGASRLRALIMKEKSPDKIMEVLKGGWKEER